MNVIAGAGADREPTADIAVILAGRHTNEPNDQTITRVRQLSETTRRNLTNLSQVDETLKYLPHASSSMRQDTRPRRGGDRHGYRFRSRTT